MSSMFYAYVRLVYSRLCARFLRYNLGHPLHLCVKAMRKPNPNVSPWYRCQEQSTKRRNGFLQIHHVGVKHLSTFDPVYIVTASLSLTGKISRNVNQSKLEGRSTKASLIVKIFQGPLTPEAYEDTGFKLDCRFEPFIQKLYRGRTWPWHSLPNMAIGKSSQKDPTGNNWINIWAN